MCEELIADGRVTVNGEVAVLGRRIDADADVVEVDGHLVPVRPGLVHYLLNKPAGVVTTAHDTHGRPTVVDLVPGEPRVFPVGRLDADTEGLLLLTNDGDLAHRLTHPSFGVDKEYLAHVDGRAECRRRCAGCARASTSTTAPTAPAKVSQPAPGVLRITIHEGRNRQVRRMCEAVGHPVERLVRVRIGSLRDQRLKPGQWRPLVDRGGEGALGGDRPRLRCRSRAPGRSVGRRSGRFAQRVEQPGHLGLERGHPGLQLGEAVGPRRVAPSVPPPLPASGT